MLSGHDRWEGGSIPSVVGTVKLACAVTLLRQQEHHSGVNSQLVLPFLWGVLS